MNGLRLLVTVLMLAQDHPQMPPGMTHDEHLKQMQKDAALQANGKIAMGFDQDATTHHFRLFSDGGSIEVVAKNKADAKNIKLVRNHLKEIAESFSKGDFEKPVMTHSEEPPGVGVMQRLKKR